MSAYTAVHQFHSGTAFGDAITQQMFSLQAHLRGLGLASEVFAEHIDPELRDRIGPIAEYDGSDGALLLWHHSIGIDAFDDILALPNDVATVYHNITPERFFADPVLRDYVRLGHEQLVRLGKRATAGVADSNFNRREMTAVGFRRVEVIPVRTDFAEFRSKGPSVRSSDWLYVGRIVGNKCQHDLVRAFAAYRKMSGDTRSRLVLIGDTSVADYVRLVMHEAKRCGVEDRLELRGKVDDEGLRRALHDCGVYVSVSEHEGFGVPLLEAMASGMPVLAYGAAAVPETMGGAGILLRSKEPALVAAAVQSVLEDEAFRERLLERQFRRVDQVQSFDVTGALGRVMAKASGADLPMEVQIQGPFETSYSLAAMNRQLSLALDEVTDRTLSIYCTEGPGDYEPAADDLAKIPDAAALYRRSASVPYPDVVIRQMWPPRVIDSPGAITCEYFGWEESRIPTAMADDFNRYLDGVGVMSEFVRDVLVDSGVDVPICVVGNGVNRPDPTVVVDAPELAGLRGFRFLHISSAFPRKGVDVLLQAYFSAFSGDDDVSLVLKTFRNPHNEVAGILGRLNREHPNPPDVRWIDRDMTDDELAGLHNLASCYVHPARGEGFGLPVAEAMLAEVPVIAVAYSGLADFVDTTTAVTIPFEVTEAATHMDIPGSTWAEPDPVALAAAMTAMVDGIDSPATQSRVRNARQVIESSFSWEAAARRWDEFLTYLEDAAQTVRVGMVTTWNSRCGVAENSRYILEYGSDGVEFAILADRVSEVVDPAAEVGVVRCWTSRWHPDLTELEEVLLTTDIDVAHIQFNFGFFELKRLGALIDRLLERMAVVLTLHRTEQMEIDGHMVSLASIATTLKRVDRVIVHQEEDVRHLTEMGITDNVQIVPLGSLLSPAATPNRVREALKLGDRPILGTFGFLLPHKGTLELVVAVDHLRQTFPDICLLALCARHPDPSSADYEAKVRREIEERRLQDNVLLVTDYLPDDVVRTILRGTDAIVLPYHDTRESSSAVLRFLLPLERPIVATDQPIFADSRQALHFANSPDPDDLEKVLTSVLTDPDLREDLTARVTTARQLYRWQRVAADHREIYVRARRRGRRAGSTTSR